jgi:hypothetical protein
MNTGKWAENECRETLMGCDVGWGRNAMPHLEGKGARVMRKSSRNALVENECRERSASRSPGDESERGQFNELKRV